jgi:RNA polymerase sigma-70 factor (ECF subfamily)
MMSDPFHDGVVALIPQLRAYATALTRSSVEADDLVQDTLMRAWRYRASFVPDTQLKPWLFKILRNRLYTQSAKRRLLVQDVDGRFAATLVAEPDQAWRLEYREMLAALDTLSPDTREALLLVLGSGLSYEEAAEVCGCAVGTMKSRVNRARDLLARQLDPPAPATRPTPSPHAPLAARAIA